MGAGFVPRLAAEHFLGLGAIAIIPIEGMRAGHTIWLATNSLAPATAAHIHFMDMLHSEHAELSLTLPLPIHRPVPVRMDVTTACD
jgi:hypothetical protein